MCTYEAIKTTAASRRVGICSLCSDVVFQLTAVNIVSFFGLVFHVLFFVLRKQLQDDDAVRASLKSCRLASLLPPVGTEFLRPFTSASLEQMSQRNREEKQKGKKKDHKVKTPPKTPISTLSCQ